MEIINDSFFEFAAILVIAVGMGLIGRLLKQPLVVSFIVVGLAVGPYGLNLLTSVEHIHLLSEMGIAVLLFVVGLKLDLSLIRTSGKVALATGLGQVIFTSVFGYYICLALGFDSVTSLYIAVALTFSSTIIIVKLLSDKKEIQSLHGQISIGFLIVQDIMVILAMIVLSALGKKNGDMSVGQEILLVALKGIAMLALVIFLTRYVMQRLASMMARTPELLVLFSLTWAIALAAMSDFLGFSKEVGAFLGGISLASTSYREVISGRLVSVRDFLLLFFFIHLGSQVNISLLGQQFIPAMILSLFVLIGNPIIVMIILGIMGYRKRTSFLAGLNVAQISEFSLILAALGLSLGQIDEETLGLITLVGLITISLSTYLINYSHQIYEWVAPALYIFERKNPFREITKENDNVPYDVIIFGLGMYGNNIAASLEAHGYSVFGVDFDPRNVKRWTRKGRHAQYGDADDPELMEILPKNSQCVVSTIPDKLVNLALIKYLRHANFPGKIAITSYSGRSAKELELSGADLILLPFVDASENIVDKLTSLTQYSAKGK